MLTRRIRTGLMTAALTLAAVLSSQATADITAKEATDLNTQAKATLAKFKAGTKHNQGSIKKSNNGEAEA